MFEYKLGINGTQFEIKLWRKIPYAIRSVVKQELGAISGCIPNSDC